MSDSHSIRLCAFEGCERQIRRNGLCSGHSQQASAGKTLKPLISKRQPKRPQVCSLCGEQSVRKFKDTYCCLVHYRVKQMRYDAQASGKTVPTAEQLEAMIRDVATAGMTCPVCKRTMCWLKGEGVKTMMTLQHDRSGEYRLICLSCNTRHQHYEGDAFYEVPEGHRKCYVCDVVKPNGDFYTHSGNHSGYRCECKQCSKAIQKQKKQERAKP